MSGHLDHLGVGGAINGDKIYNGAMDNASGCRFDYRSGQALSKQKLKRTVVFRGGDGGRRRIDGLKAFAAHPTVPAADIVANINLDMYLPIIPLKALTVYGMDESDLGQEFCCGGIKFHVDTVRDPEPKRNLFIRSDQYSFVRQGVPALTFKFSAADGTPEAKTLSTWITTRYHAPSDDLQQPVDAEAAVQFNRVITTFITQIAKPGRAAAVEERQFFRRYATPARP
jgi:Zn-dependent M28 family amino/carboxypeptidase